MTGQTGYLRSDALALVEQAELPSFGDVRDLKPAQCHTEAGGTFSWALRDNAVDGGAARVRAVLLSRCGLVEGREGSFPRARFQLLVYGDGGQLDVLATSKGRGARLGSARRTDRSWRAGHWQAGFWRAT